MKTILEFLTVTIIAALFAMPQAHIPSAATDPAAHTSVVEQSAADVSETRKAGEVSQLMVQHEEAEVAGDFTQPAAERRSPAQPAPVYRVARPAPTRQYSSCGPGGCNGGRFRIFGRR